MQAGRLKERVTLQRNDYTRDAAGGQVDNWVDVDTVWASVRPVTGREFYAAMQRQADVTFEVRIRHRDDVGTAWRLKYRVTRILNIKWLLDVNERRRELVMGCVEDVG